MGAGPLTGSGTEAGTHTIVVTDATKSSITSGTIPITVHGKIDVVIDGTNEDLTLVMGGETIAITLTHTDHTTTIGDVALDIATQIGLSAYTGTVTVTAPGGNTIKIEIDKAGSSNSIDPISGISGGAATALLFNNDGITAGTNAKAVDTFTPATNSNGL